MSLPDYLGIEDHIAPVNRSIIIRYRGLRLISAVPDVFLFGITSVFVNICFQFFLIVL